MILYSESTGLCCVAELNDERELSTMSRLACGGVAGTTGQTVAYPLDVVRRRMQVLPHAVQKHVNSVIDAGSFCQEIRALPD